MLRTQDKRLNIGRQLADVLQAYRPTVFDDEGRSGSNGTALTAPASTNTKADWTQITASCPIDADGFFVEMIVGQNGAKDFLFDIGIGGAGAETVILENVLFTAPVGSNEYLASDFFVPLRVAAGTRVAARYQCSSTTSDEMFCEIQFVKGEWYRGLTCRRAATYGASTADSGGTSIDPGGSADTKGNYSQLSAAVTNPIRYALICVGGQGNGARSGFSWQVDIGVGAALSETVIVPNLYVRAGVAIDQLLPTVVGRGMTVRAGQRLAARAQCNGTDATDRLLDLVVIGFDGSYE